MGYRHADRRSFHYIYKITRHDGKYYIGMHSTDNLEDGYFGSGRILWYSIKKHGKQAHNKQVLEFLPSRALLKEREKQLVTKDLLTDPFCMNLALGGGSCASDEQRAKWQLAARKKPQLSEVQRAAMSLARSLRRHSAETKALMSAKAKGVKKSPEHLAKIAASRLANMSNETRQKLCVNKGKHWYNDGVKSFLLTPSEALGLVRGRL